MNADKKQLKNKTLALNQELVQKKREIKNLNKRKKEIENESILESAKMATTKIQCLRAEEKAKRLERKNVKVQEKEQEYIEKDLKMHN